MQEAGTHVLLAFGDDRRNLMGKTAVGLYETSAEAQGVLSDLIQAGYSRNYVRIMLGDRSARGLYEWDENQPESGRGAQWADGGASAALVSMGVPRTDAQNYEEALHRGNALVSVATTDERINEAVEIMRHHRMIDTHGEMHGWQKTASTGAAAAGAAATNRNLKSDEEATIRRTDVEVEKLGGEPIHKDFEAWDLFGEDFHTHYNKHYANSGHVYADYEPAYRYGYTLATRPDWRGRSWDEIEADARRQWERDYRDQGPWEDFKDAVRHAWMRVTR